MNHFIREIWWVDANGDDQVTECCIYFIWNHYDKVAEIEKIEDERGRSIEPSDLNLKDSYFQDIADDYCAERA